MSNVASFITCVIAAGSFCMVSSVPLMRVAVNVSSNGNVHVAQSVARHEGGVFPAKPRQPSARSEAAMLLEQGAEATRIEAWATSQSAKRKREYISLIEKANASLRRTIWQEQGIALEYISLLEKANASLQTMVRTEGSKGVVLVASGGVEYVFNAAKAARRIYNSLAAGERGKIQVALFSEQQYVKALDECKPPIAHEWCDMWAKGSIFDGGVYYLDAFPLPVSAKNWTSFQSTAKFQMQHGGIAFARGPFETSLFLDTDAYTCPGFAKLFTMAHPFSEKLFSFPSTKTVDLAVGVDQYPYNRDHRLWPSPGDLNKLSDFQYFADRNTGTVLVHYNRPLVSLWASFHELVVAHLYDEAARDGKRVITNDQVPFKLALYLFTKMLPDFNEQTIPMHLSCRAYTQDDAGIQGQNNGMWPQDCKACSCTPCLIAHSPMHFIELQEGFSGWENVHGLRPRPIEVKTPAFERVYSSRSM